MLQRSKLVSRLICCLYLGDVIPAMFLGRVDILRNREMPPLILVCCVSAILSLNVYLASIPPEYQPMMILVSFAAPPWFFTQQPFLRSYEVLEVYEVGLFAVWIFVSSTTFSMLDLSFAKPWGV